MGVPNCPTLAPPESADAPLHCAPPEMRAAGGKRGNAVRSRAVVAFPEHAIIRPAGAVSGGALRIVTGYVRLSVPTSDGDHRIVAILGAGDWIGISPEGLHLCEARTLTPVSAREAGNLTDLSRQDLIEMTLGVQSQLESVLQHCMTLVHLPPLERAACFLVSWSRRPHPPSNGRNVGGGRDVELDIPLRMKDVANHLGVTSETISRVFAKLKHRRLIDTVGGRSTIRVIDVAALEALYQQTQRVTNARPSRPLHSGDEI